MCINNTSVKKVRTVWFLNFTFCAFMVQNSDFIMGKRAYLGPLHPIMMNQWLRLPCAFSA